MNNKNEVFKQFFLTFLISVIVIFAVSFCVELELLFRCQNNVNAQELAVKGVLEFYNIEQLEKKIKDEPKNYFLYVKLARTYEDLKDYQTANRYYNSAIKIAPDSNYVLYNYAMFCAKRKLYVSSATFCEKLSGNNDKIYKYKAQVYEIIADNLLEDEDYIAAQRAYQVAYKYAKTYSKETFKIIKAKYAKSYFLLADYYIQKNMIKEGHMALNNSLKIKKTPEAEYMLALMYKNSKKIYCEKLMSKVFLQKPYIVNPDTYILLLNSIILDEKKKDSLKTAKYYEIKLEKFKKAAKELYITQNEISISNSKINKKTKPFSNKVEYYLTFDLINNTKTKISQLYIMTEIFKNDKKYTLNKKVVKRSHTLKPFFEFKDITIKIPDDFAVDILSENKAITLKYSAKKSTDAPWTLIKIESANF